MALRISARLSLAVYAALAAGEVATDTFSETGVGGRGGTANANVTVTIPGANDAAAITGAVIQLVGYSGDLAQLAIV